MGAMGVRFFRRMRIAPGLTLNLSKSGPSLSMGVRGAHVTVGRRGVRRTVGLPGTGLFYTSHTGYHTGAHTAKAFAQSPAERERQKLLRHLDALHRAGVLNDAEYAAKKQGLTGP
jgi:Protein of unknown function (DUF4236)